MNNNKFKMLILISETGNCSLSSCMDCLIKEHCSHMYISEDVGDRTFLKKERKRLAKLKIKQIIKEKL